MYALAKQGKQIFQTNGLCFKCHAKDGDGRYDPDAKEAYLNPRPTDFTKPNRRKYTSEDARYAVTRNGIDGTGMVPFRGILTDAEIRLLIDYLEVLKDGC